MSVKMAGTIPVDHNGLSAIYGALVQEPARQLPFRDPEDAGR